MATTTATTTTPMPTEEPLGPIDVAAWGAGILGVAIGLVIAVCFAWATSAPG